MSSESELDTEELLRKGYEGCKHHVVQTTGVVYSPSLTPPFDISAGSITISHHVKPYTATPEDFRGMTADKPWNIAQNEFVIRMAIDVPGVTKDEIKVCVTDNELLVTASVFERHRTRNYRFSHRVPHEADIHNASSELEHGVLTVTFKRVKRAAFVNVPVR